MLEETVRRLVSLRLSEPGTRLPVPAFQGTLAPVILVSVLVAVPFSGCVQPLQEGFAVPGPDIGATYTYEGPRHARLNVTIDGPTTRLDAHLQPHRTLLLNVTYRRPGGNFTYDLQTAVDVRTGRIVQQVARCVPWDRHLPNGEQPRACLDERAVVAFGADGWPGAFGAGPLWDHRIQPGPAGVELHPQGATSVSNRTPYRAQPNGSQEGCLDVAATDLRVQRMAHLPHLVTAGPFTLCPDRALPVAFSTALGMRFQLTGHTPGAGSVPRGEDPGEGDPAPPVEPRTWEAPIVVDPDDGNPFRFSFEEAHRWALENHQRYHRIVAEEPTGLVVGTTTYQAGQTRVGEGPAEVETNRSDRELVAIEPGGSGIKLTLEKRRHGTGDTWQATIGVKEEENVSLDTVPTEASLAPQQAAMRDAVQLGRRLIGTRLAIVSQEVTYRPLFWSPRDDFRRPVRADGYTSSTGTSIPRPSPAPRPRSCSRTVSRSTGRRGRWTGCR